MTNVFQPLLLIAAVFSALCAGCTGTVGGGDREAGAAGGSGEGGGHGGGGGGGRDDDGAGGGGAMAGADDGVTDPVADEGGAMAQSLGEPPVCRADRPPASPARVWRLSAAQYASTVAALFGGHPPRYDNPFDGSAAQLRFSNHSVGLNLPEATAEQVVLASEVISKALAGKLQVTEPCVAAKRDAACVGPVLNKVAETAFRRPMTASELTAFSRLYTDLPVALLPARALEYTLQAMLNAPQFLFRTELGDGTVDAFGRTKLTPNEIASAIAYSITDAPPDPELMALAKQGVLQTADEVRAQVRRLFTTAGAKGPALRFFREFFRYPLAAETFKDAKHFPYHRPDQMVADTDLFITDLFLTTRGGFLRALMTSPDGYASSLTASTYGIKQPSSQPVKTNYPTGQRAGILTQPSFLVAFSEAESTDPIRRGKFISESLLCRPVPSLPIGLIPKLPETAGLTVRAKLEAHVSHPGCAACHELMDPIGLPLEGYDHMARFRTHEMAKPVVTTGTLSGAGLADGPVKGAIDLAARLADSPVVAECFTRHAFGYWLGRDELSNDGCAVIAARDALIEADGDLVEAFVSLLSSEALLYRTPAP